MVVEALLIAAAGAAAPDRVALEAFRRQDGKDRVVWNVEVTLGAECKAKGGEKIDPPACERIRKESAAASAAPGAPAGAKVQAQRMMRDEPRYRLKLGAQPPTEVAFEAPSTCEVGDDGAIDCKNQDLTPAQRLLLELRALHPNDEK